MPAVAKGVHDDSPTRIKPDAGSLVKATAKGVGSVVNVVGKAVAKADPPAVGGSGDAAEPVAEDPRRYQSGVLDDESIGRVMKKPAGFNGDTETENETETETETETGSQA